MIDMLENSDYIDNLEYNSIRIKSFANINYNLDLNRNTFNLGACIYSEKYNKKIFIFKFFGFGNNVNMSRLYTNKISISRLHYISKRIDNLLWRKF